jgi:hypothetical protein
MEAGNCPATAPQVVAVALAVTLTSGNARWTTFPIRQYWTKTLVGVVYIPVLNDAVKLPAS